MAIVVRRCAWCGSNFKARSADVKRGWARFCSKSCKASEQESRTHQHADYNKRRYYEETYGGHAEFDSRGEYVGFTCINGSDDHDCNKE